MEKGRLQTATSMGTLQIVGAAIGVGAPDEGCAEAPFVLRDGALIDNLRLAGLPAAWGAIHLSPRRDDGADPVETVADLGRRMAADIETLVRDGRHFVAIGGDHTAGIGVWSGAARALRRLQPNRTPDMTPPRFGLVWIDAHMDAHTFATTPSRMVHGMPVACLLGHGEPALTSLAGEWPAVTPENLCLIGTRSWEEGEAALLQRLGVRVITMTEVRRRGFADALREGLDIASAGTAGFGVSLDIDALDPHDAPGTGLPTEDGIRSADLIAAIQGISTRPRFVGLEIAEYNPARDRDNVTAILIQHVISACYGSA